MRRFAMFILAVVLTVATVAVPVKLAAHSGRVQAPATADWQIAAEVVSEARNGAVPAKRCQSGAGLLACPFYRPAVVVAFSAAIDAAIRFEAESRPLIGRVVPTSSGPPKVFSV